MSNFYMWYVYRKVLTCRKQNFCPFSTLMKIDLNRGKSMKMTKMSKKHIQFLACKKVIFNYFWKWTKGPFSTFQGLSKDILHVKIGQLLRIFQKCILRLKKVRFPSFFTLAVGKIWFKLIKCMCNIIFYHNLTFKIHRFQRYSL